MAATMNVQSYVNPYYLGQETYMGDIDFQSSRNWPSYSQIPHPIVPSSNIIRDLPPSLLNNSSYEQFRIASQTAKAVPEQQEYRPRQPDASVSPQTSVDSTQLSPISQDAPPHSSEPLKRKRGRPKSEPQMMESQTASGQSIQVPSARETHLQKGRQAAHKCRERKKDYVNELETRAQECTAKNEVLKDTVAMLREEVLALKGEVLRHAGCGFWTVDEYLSRSAGDILGRERSKPIGTGQTSGFGQHYESPRLTQSAVNLMSMQSEPRYEEPSRKRRSFETQIRLEDDASFMDAPGEIME